MTKRTKEEYLLLRVMGKTREEIREEWGLLSPVMDIRLTKWQLLTAEQEQKGLEAYRASLPTPAEPEPAMPENSEPSNPARAMEFAWLKVPLIPCNGSTEDQAAEVFAALEHLDNMISRYHDRVQITEALLGVLMETCKLLQVDAYELLPPDRAIKKVRTLLVRANKEYLAKVEQS